MNEEFKPRGIEKCRVCSRRDGLVRVNRFDAIACKHCKIWLESKCPYSLCEFCAKRPPNAHDVDFSDPKNTDYQL